MPARLIAIGFAVIVGFAACSDDPACLDCGEGGQPAGGAGGEAPDPASEYCSCMLTICHDAYHATYGPDTDEPAARAACMALAESLPEAGMDVDSGNFIECLMHYCALQMESDEICASAVGEGSCAP